MILHCVFRHNFVSPAINSRLWDLACDIAVENMITELKARGTEAPGGKRQGAYLEEIKRRKKQVTAEKTYAYLKEENPGEKKLAAMEEALCVDDQIR